MKSAPLAALALQHDLNAMLFADSMVHLRDAIPDPFRAGRHEDEVTNPRDGRGAVADVVGNRGGVVSGLFNEP